MILCHLVHAKEKCTTLNNFSSAACDINSISFNFFLFFLIPHLCVVDCGC